MNVSLFPITFQNNEIEKKTNSEIKEQTKNVNHLKWQFQFILWSTEYKEYNFVAMLLFMVHIWHLDLERKYLDLDAKYFIMRCFQAIIGFKRCTLNIYSYNKIEYFQLSLNSEQKTTTMNKC